MGRSRIAGCLAAGVLMVLMIVSPASAAAQQTTGRIVGHVTTSAGAPAPDVAVSVRDAANGRLVDTATTDVNGAYAAVAQLDPFSSHVKIEFRTPSFRFQWAHQKRSFQEAEVIPVINGQDTVVDEMLFPSGKLEFTAINKVTGQRIDEFCGEAFGAEVGRNGCTTTGSLLLSDLPPGDYQTSLSPGIDYFGERKPATVTAEQITAVAFALDPAALITTTIQDAVTGAPVANACVIPVGHIGGFGEFAGWCSESDGRITIGRLTTGAYRLYAKANDGAHGAQWVGPRGGTGTKDRARVVNAVAGQTVTVPPIRLDGAGSISGTVVDAGTGLPVKDVCAFSHAGATTGGPDITPYCTKEDGRYTISGLGPYPWVVQFIATVGTHAWQWSGDRPTQATAQRVPVRPGMTTALDAHLGVTTPVTGRVTGSDGQPIRNGVIQAYNADTGDSVADYTFTDADGNYRLEGIAGPQSIRVQYWEVNTDNRYWYRNASSFESADPVFVPKGGAVGGIDIVVPTG